MILGGEDGLINIGADFEHGTPKTVVVLAEVVDDAGQACDFALFVTGFQATEALFEIGDAILGALTGGTLGEAILDSFALRPSVVGVSPTGLHLGWC